MDDKKVFPLFSGHNFCKNCKCPKHNHNIPNKHLGYCLISGVIFNYVRNFIKSYLEPTINRKIVKIPLTPSDWTTSHFIVNAHPDLVKLLVKFVSANLSDS